MMSGAVGGKEPGSSAFFRCDEPAGCGLRFPVTPADKFSGCCPRCGGTVIAVAAIGPPDGECGLVTPIPQQTNLSLLLDNWRSVFNVGAIFRSADGAGARHLYLCGITASPDSQRKLHKTALGAEQAVAWSYHADAVKLAAQLKAEGAQLWILERGAGASSLFDITCVPGDAPVVLAAGNEVAGVDPGLDALADKHIQLPMAGRKESLNVAIALSIAIYWLAAQEQQGKEEVGDAN